MEYSICAVR